MRRVFVIGLLGVALTLALATAPVAGALASAQEESPPPTEWPEPQPIVPKPNSGSAPTDPGDRGGALQSGLFVIVVGGVGLIGVFVVRESRKVRANRGF